jgi:RNA polymerase sigma-70 factor, ECF subfamily
LGLLATLIYGMLSGSIQSPSLVGRFGRAEPGVGEKQGIASLQRLYEEHVEFVRRAVIRLGGPDADVEDLVHDVFVVALRAHERFEGRALVSTWLYGIALRVVAAARRRQRTRRFFGLDDAPEPVDPRTPQRLFEDREASRLVYRALDKVSERKRTVFILFELEGLSGEEIAAIVDCPVKTVWTRLHHARKEFQVQLDRVVRPRVQLAGGSV